MSDRGLPPPPPLLCSGCSVFGRDEGGSEFTFTQQHVDTLVTKWQSTMGATTGLAAAQKPDASRMAGVLELCISGEIRERTRALLCPALPCPALPCSACPHSSGWLDEEEPPS